MARNPLTPLKNAFSRIDALSLLFSVLLDASFLFAYGFLTAPVRDKIVEHAIIIGNILSEASKQFLQTRQASPGIIELLLTNAAIRPFLVKLVVLLLLLLLVVYVIYCFFQGTNWKLAQDLVGKKMPYHQYMILFARVNIFWFLFFGVHAVLSTLVSLRGVVVERVLQVAPSAAPQVMLNIVFGILLFLAFLSYGLLGVKKPIRSALQLSIQKKSITMLVVLVAAFAIINYLLVWAAGFTTALQLLLGVVVLLPAVFVTRLYVMSVIVSKE